MAGLMKERPGINTNTFLPLGLEQLKMAPRCEQTQKENCLLCKVILQVKVKPAIFGLGACAQEASPSANWITEATCRKW